jgi:alkanesulfonate monooxygenase SsuD/methylene tetrahydromethanopterin reductase-like flavin-dependent oxidoreductase (luciferase family)
MAPVTPIRQPRGTGVALRDPLPWREFARAAVSAEDLGYVAAFLPEIAGRDALAALTGLAGETSSLLLGTGVIPMTSRTPMLTAMGAATVQERSGGRAILGVGTGPPAPGALDRLRELVSRLRSLVQDAPGGGVPASPLSLHVPAPVPIWISALGPRALRLAGEVADGVLLNWCPPERVRQATGLVAEGAASAGRSPAEVTIAVYVRANLDGDATALDALRRATGEYASYPAYARQLAAVGLGEDAVKAAAAHRADRPREVPEPLVHALTLAGDADSAHERLQAYRDAGADLPVVYPVTGAVDPGGSVAATIHALAPRAPG